MGSHPRGKRLGTIEFATVHGLSEWYKKANPGGLHRTPFLSLVRKKTTNKLPNDFENRTSKPTNSTPLSQNPGPAHQKHSVCISRHQCNNEQYVFGASGVNPKSIRVVPRRTCAAAVDNDKHKLIIGCGTSSEMGFERWHFHQLQCLQRMLELKRVSDGRCKRNGCETPISGRRKPSDSKGSSSKTLYIKYRWVGLGIFQGCRENAAGHCGPTKLCVTWRKTATRKMERTTSKLMFGSMLWYAETEEIWSCKLAEQRRQFKGYNKRFPYVMLT